VGSTRPWKGPRRGKKTGQQKKMGNRKKEVLRSRFARSLYQEEVGLAGANEKRGGVGRGAENESQETKLRQGEKEARRSVRENFGSGTLQKSEKKQTTRKQKQKRIGEKNQKNQQQQQDPKTKKTHREKQEEHKTQQEQTPKKRNHQEQRKGNKQEKPQKNTRTTKQKKSKKPQKFEGGRKGFADNRIGREAEKKIKHTRKKPYVQKKGGLKEVPRDELKKIWTSLNEEKHAKHRTIRQMETQ